MTNLLVPMVDNQDVTASYFNTTITNMGLVAYLASDVTINNEVDYSTPPDLSLPIVPQARYVFKSCLFYDTNSTADIDIGIEVPSGTILVSPWSSPTTITTGTNNLDMGAPALDSFQLLICGGVAAGTVLCVRPAGYVVVGTASGVFDITFVQEQVGVSDTILKQGSWVSLTRVG